MRLFAVSVPLTRVLFLRPLVRIVKDKCRSFDPLPGPLMRGTGGTRSWPVLPFPPPLRGGIPISGTFPRAEARG